MLSLLSSVAMAVFPTGFPMIGSTSFTMLCNAQQQPWMARLDSDGWYRFDTPIPSPGEPVFYQRLQDSYNPSATSLTYTYVSQLTFVRPLSVSDGGEYSCNVSVQLTYPDNSTYLLTNSTSYTLFIHGMQYCMMVHHYFS